jgi:hypothetical protein
MHASLLCQADPLVLRFTVRLGGLRLCVACDDMGHGGPVRMANGKAEGCGATLRDANDGMRGVDVQMVEEEANATCEAGNGAGGW